MLSEIDHFLLELSPNGGQCEFDIRFRIFAYYSYYCLNISLLLLQVVAKVLRKIATERRETFIVSTFTEPILMRFSTSCLPVFSKSEYQSQFRI